MTVVAVALCSKDRQLVADGTDALDVKAVKREQLWRRFWWRMVVKKLPFVGQYKSILSATKMKTG